jgi:zeaxanthin glucosyltransferase
VPRIGAFCLPMRSHMSVFLELAAALREHGHEIVFFCIPMNAARIREQGFDHRLIEPDAVPSGTLDSMIRQMGTLEGGDALKLLGRFEDLRYEAVLRHGPALVEQARLDAMIVDQAEACSGSVAEAAGLPWVSVCNGLPLNSEPGVPPCLTAWSYSEKRAAVTRNKLAYAGLNIAWMSRRSLINRYRKAWRLEPHQNLDQTFSPFAQISQQIREFDFPRRHLPDTFHYAGPLMRDGTGSVEFPWDRLDGRALIYASLGTVVNRNARLYRIIIDACSAIHAQLVLSLGGGGNADAYRDLPGSPIVVDFAPQLELLRKATIAITHGGLNSALESLGQGVPLVAIPVAFDQPGVAARVRWTGAGEFIPSSKIDAHRLRTTVERVLRESSYRDAARRIRDALTSSGGLNEAVRVIEEVIRTGRPVVAAAQLN